MWLGRNQRPVSDPPERLSPEEQGRARAWRSAYGYVYQHETVHPERACEAGPRQMPVAETLDRREVDRLRFVAVVFDLMEGLV